MIDVLLSNFSTNLLLLHKGHDDEYVNSDWRF